VEYFIISMLEIYY